jgi:hypothetical protein
MSSGFLMLTGDDKSPLTIIHDSVIETDPAHDLTHLAPEVGDSDFPLDLDNIPFDGFDMDELLELSARSDAAVVTACESRPLASATSTPDSLTPSSAGISDSAFGGSASEAGSSPFSFDSRCSPADDFGHRHLRDVMSGGSANCSPFSLESDSSDQFRHQEDDRNAGSSDGAFPFSLESLVSDVVVSSPGEEDPDIMMMPFCRSSSIGDSPPSSSRSFDCDSDLDLYSNCNTDLGLFTDDTFLDSLLTSNLPDVISGNAADDLISSLHHCNESTTAAANSGSQMNSHINSSSGNNRDFFLPSLNNSKLPPPLPLTSSLATLLQQKTIMSPGVKTSSKNSTNHAIRANNNSSSSISASSSGGSTSKTSAKGTGHGNSSHATNSHILVQNGHHFTIYKILAATQSSSSSSSSGTTSVGGSGVAASPASITSAMDVGTSHKGVAKRFLTGVSSQLPPNKRIHIDSGSFSSSSVRQHPKPVNGNSVLMNLLVNGEDVRNGYTSSSSGGSSSHNSSSRKSNAAGSRSGTTTYSCPFD